MIHLVTIAGFSVLSLSIIYYFYQITPLIVGIVLSIVFVAGFLTSPVFRKMKERKKSLPPYAVCWMLGSILTSFLIIILLWISQTDEAIASPWQAVTPIIFLLYAFASTCTVCVARMAPSRWSLPILMVFGVATFGVSLIIYKLGFGYDPFVHQATEQHILEHGFIFPKQPMYIGQYVSVVLLSWLTALSIHLVDRILVPFLSTLVMIPMIFTAFRYGWMKKIKQPALALLALFLIPVGYFAFSVPFNLALLALVLIIGFFPLADEPRVKWLIASLGCVSIAIHPLIGIPTILLAIIAICKKFPAWLLAICIPIFLFIAFSIYFHLQGASIIWPSMNQAMNAFTALFGNPYELARGPLYLAILYALLYLSPPILIGTAMYGYASALPKDQALRRSVWALGYASIGVIASAIVIPLFFSFPNIIASEQFEFSLRLLLILPLLWLPGLAYAIHAGLNQTSSVKKICVLIVIALAMTGAWAASYPQYNAISYAPAPGLSQGDIDAVRFIESNAQDAPYAVLSSQMMGAAALTEFGFEKQISTHNGPLYAYAIPTGGKLYQYYLRFISSDEDPQNVAFELYQFTDAPLIYISIPDSWDPQGQAIKKLAPITLNHFEVGGNRIFKLKVVRR